VLTRVTDLKRCENAHVRSSAPSQDALIRQAEFRDPICRHRASDGIIGSFGLAEKSGHLTTGIIGRGCGSEADACSTNVEEHGELRLSEGCDSDRDVISAAQNLEEYRVHGRGERLNIGTVGWQPSRSRVGSSIGHGQTSYRNGSLTAVVRIPPVLP
jgi:hypothetical protein